MTIDEMLAREAIRKTMATYNQCGDRARYDELALQFTEDGVLETPNGVRHEGREAVRASFNRIGSGKPASAEPDPSRPKLTFVRHHTSTCKIDLTGPDSATARTYWAVYTNIGPDHCGYYADTFRKVGDDWLIAERKARTDWISPDSLMASPRKS